MSLTIWIALLVLTLILTFVTATWFRPLDPRREQRIWIRSAFRLPLTIVLVLVLGACGRATSEKTVRKLAGSPEAVKARKEAEAAGRGTIGAWEAETPLTLGLVILEDVCIGGRDKEWFFQTGDDKYKIRCMLSISAYFGADPRTVADTIDGVLSAGDQTDSPIAFNHDFLYARTVVDYYRGKNGAPVGHNAVEPTRLSKAGTITLNWDQVRGENRRELIDEPRSCAPHDPPIKRCLKEPGSTTVKDLRNKYGMVFKITIPIKNYYTIRK
ncbi:hypothetical protein ACFWPP_28970 [Streptomyces anulatus]|uniref:hypothetical protein n=1 Tax=Streptomyces anulatus TaxID=1892 RepID=UPI0036681521